MMSHKRHSQQPTMAAMINSKYGYSVLLIAQDFSIYEYLNYSIKEGEI